MDGSTSRKLILDSSTIPSYRYVRLNDMDDILRPNVEEIDRIRENLMFQGISHVNVFNEGVAYATGGVKRHCEHDRKFYAAIDFENIHYSVSSLMSCEMLCLLQASENHRSCHGYTFNRLMLQCTLYPSINNLQRSFSSACISCSIVVGISKIQEDVDYLAISTSVSRHFGKTLQK